MKRQFPYLARGRANWMIYSSIVLLAYSFSGMAGESKLRLSVRDIEYARVGERGLKLDLHRPIGPARAPLIVWVHGGAWRSGSKTDMPLGKLVEEGYAVASVEKVNALVQFEVVHGAAHGGAAFYDAERMALVKKFLRRHF